MGSVRRHVRRVAGTWLVLQFLVTTCVPVALYASTHHASAKQDCTCEHPAGGVCPMHRHSSAPSSTNGCAVRGAIDPLDSLVASLIGTVGVLAAPVTGIAAIGTTDRFVRIERTPLEHFVPPDAPPPRA